MATPIEMLTIKEAHTANEIVLDQVVVQGEDVSWDWTLRSLARRTPLAVSSYRSTRSEPAENLEIAVDLTLGKVGLKLQGAPVQERLADGLLSLRYRVSRDAASAPSGVHL